MTEFPETRAEVLRRIRSPRDREAWEEFVSMYRPIVYRMARRRGLQDADAQDLVQRVMFAVSGSIERWEQRDENTRFRHWLRRVTKNAVHNALTRQPHDRGRGGSEIQELLTEQQEPGSDYEQAFALETRREIFHRAASVVQSEVRGNTWLAFQLTVIEGLTVRDAAVKLGISEGGIYAAQGRTIERLRRVVEELEEEDA